MSAERLFLKVVGEVRPRDCEVTVFEEDDYAIFLRLVDGTILTGRGDDAFEALARLREHLERLGLRLACMGSLINVFPSGMLRQMLGGRRAYLLSMPRTSRRPTVVDILDPAPAGASLATVEEQQRWFSAWADQDLSDSSGGTQPDLMETPGGVPEVVLEGVRILLSGLLLAGLSSWADMFSQISEANGSGEEKLNALSWALRTFTGAEGEVPNDLRDRADRLALEVDLALAGLGGDETTRGDAAM